MEYIWVLKVAEDNCTLDRYHFKTLSAAFDHIKKLFDNEEVSWVQDTWGDFYSRDVGSGTYYQIEKIALED